MKVVKSLLGLVVLGVILTIAFFLFVYTLIIAALFLGYWWWKTRTLRKNLRNAAQNYAQQRQATEAGYVIEGEVIRNTGNMPATLLGEVITVQTTVERTHGRNN